MWRILAAVSSRQDFRGGAFVGKLWGLELAHEHPEVVYAYVETGQVVDMQKNEATAYRDAVEAARRANNQEALKDLEPLAPYPGPSMNMQKVGTVHGWASRLLGPAAGSVRDFTDVPTLLTAVVSVPEYSLGDDVGFIRGMNSSAEILLPQIMQVELSKLGTKFEVPVLFLEGRHDPFCRPEPVEEYEQAIEGPRKEMV